MEEYLPIIKDIILCITALVAAGVAIRGLSAWKRQISGKGEYEIAQRLLKATYKLRESIRIVRNPVLFGTEMPDPRTIIRLPDQIHIRGGIALVKLTKADGRGRNSQIDIESELLEAEVLWGSYIRDKFSNCLKLSMNYTTALSRIWIILILMNEKNGPLKSPKPIAKFYMDMVLGMNSRKGFKAQSLLSKTN